MPPAPGAALGRAIGGGTVRTRPPAARARSRCGRTHCTVIHAAPHGHTRTLAWRTRRAAHAGVHGLVAHTEGAARRVDARWRIRRAVRAALAHHAGIRRPRDALRAQRRREHRVSGARRRPIDLVFVMGWVSHLEYFWTEPTFARFLRRLASFSRLILFDKRGTGLSDRVTVLPSLEQRMDDVRAVMDAVGLAPGGAARRVRRRTDVQPVRGDVSREDARARDDRQLRAAPARARLSVGADARASVEAFYEEIQRNWGGPVGIEARAPSRLHDPQFREWWSTYLRMGASPGAALALTQHERRHRRAARAAARPRARRWSCIASGDRCLTSRKAATSPSAFPARGWWSCPARITCRSSAIRMDARRDRKVPDRLPDDAADGSRSRAGDGPPCVMDDDSHRRARIAAGTTPRQRARA